MSPWTAIGWILVVLIAGPIAIKIIFGLGELVGAAFEEIKRARRLRRAHKGKVRCDYRDCEAIATRRGASGFVCEKHVGTYVTSKSIRAGSVSFAFKLDHAKEAK